MSELINNAQKRRDLLKHMIFQLHKGEAPEAVRTQLMRLLGQVPYGEVVLVEQELISEGLPVEEVVKLCDIHSAALKGQIDQSGVKDVPPGHPVDTFKKENRALEWESQSLANLYNAVGKLPENEDAAEIFAQIRIRFNALTDVDKHYRRKENLLFPYLESHGVTGPPKVMWGKHDEVREYLKAAIDTLTLTPSITAGEGTTIIQLVLKPASDAIEEMIYKEEQILFPMSLDTLTEQEWYNVYRQSLEIGFCLYDPQEEWQPTGVTEPETSSVERERMQFPTGSLTAEELTAILNTIPFDLTFVDKDDTVRYFTQGRERIFDRNRAVLGRKAQLCHPPKSVHIVENILENFHAGRQTRAPFWIELKGRFIHIEYFALKDAEGDYLGTLEVSQDLTEKRALQGEQRLLSYVKD